MNLSKGKVLLIGGAGFIGSNLTSRLIREGYQIVILDNLLNQVHGGTRPDFLNLGVEFIEGDCSEWKWANHPRLRNNSFDCIVLLAAETGTEQSKYEAQRYVRTNIESIAVLNDLLVNSESMLSKIRHSGSMSLDLNESNSPIIATKKIILLSSRAVYGEGPLSKSGKPLPSRENDIPNPRSVYGATKLAQESLVLSGFPGIQKVILRLQNVYGEGQSLKNPYTGAVVQFAQKAHFNLPIPVYSDGGMIRDFVHVDDVVQAIVVSIQSNFGEEKIFNVGSGSSTTILELAQYMVALAQSTSMIKLTGSTFHGDIRNNYADITQFQGYGFTAKVTLKHGLVRLLDWVKKVHSDTI